MGMFKRAAARGIAHELVRSGQCSFPSKQAMDAAADAIADAAPGMPEVTPPEGHSPEHVALVANKLIEMAHELMASAGPQGAPAAAEVAKTSAAADYETLASDVAVECMDKAAAEVKQAGSLMHGGDKQNTPAAAAKENEVAALDAKQRAQGKHLVGVGSTQMHTESGAIGDLGKHPEQPSNTVSGANSLSKAAYERIIYKHAQALMKGGDKQNTPAAAAKTNDVAALDQAQRPQGKYLVGQGNANIDVPNEAHVGREHPATVQPKNKAVGSNSVTQASKMAGLSEDEQAYLSLFQKTAADVAAYLPAALTDDAKIAALQRMVPMSTQERQAELDRLYKSASTLPEALADLKADEPKEKKKKDETPEAEGAAEESKKESALLTQIRGIAAGTKTL